VPGVLVVRFIYYPNFLQEYTLIKENPEFTIARVASKYKHQNLNILLILYFILQNNAETTKAAF